MWLALSSNHSVISANFHLLSATVDLLFCHFFSCTKELQGLNEVAGLLWAHGANGMILETEPFAYFNPAIHFSYWNWTCVQGFFFVVVVFACLFLFFCFVAVFNFSPGRYHRWGLIRNEKSKRAFAVGLLGYFQISDSSVLQLDMKKRMLTLFLK